MSETTEKISIFVAYSSHDKQWVEKILISLTVLEREQYVNEIWNFKLIEPGSDWNQEIKNKLLSAEIVLLIITPNFIGSEYCYNVEMKEAMKNYELGKNVVIPIIVRECLWEEGPFSKLQVLPEDGKAVSSFNEKKQDKIIANITRSIKNKAIQINKNDETLRKKISEKMKNRKEFLTENDSSLSYNNNYLYKELEIYKSKTIQLEQTVSELITINEFISYLAFGNNVEALEKIDELLKKDPSENAKFIAYENKARILIRQKGNKAVYDIGEKMIKKYPTNYNGYHWRGLANYRIIINRYDKEEGKVNLDVKDLIKCLGDFNQSIKIFGNQIKDRINQIEILILLNNYEEAQRKVREAKDHVVLKNDFHIVILDCLYEICNIIKGKINNVEIEELIIRINEFTRLSHFNYTTKEIDIGIKYLKLKEEQRNSFEKLSTAMKGINDIQLE